MLNMSHSWRRTALALAVTGAAILAGCGAKSPQDLAADGKAAFAKKDYKNAVLQLKGALQQQPESGELRLMLGEALLNSGDPSVAVVELNKAMEQGADPDKAVPLLALGLLRTGDYKRLVNVHANTQLKSKDAQAALKAYLAAGWEGVGDPVKSAAALESALATSPDYPPVALLRVRQLAGLRQFDAALAIIDKQLALDPSSTEAWVLKGDLLVVGKGDDKGGAVAFRKALEIDKTVANAHYALVKIAMRSGDSAAAKAAFDKLKADLPKHPLTAYVDALMTLNSGDLPAAREKAQQLMRATPNNTNVLLLAGAVAAQSRQLIQAETHFSKALQINGELTPARTGLGRVYLLLNQPARTLETLKPVLAADATDVGALSLAGEAQLALGDAQAAENYFLRAAKISPDNTRLKTSLALTHLSRGDADVAFSELAAVAGKDRSILAEQAAFAARMRRREFDAALAVVDQIAKKQPDGVEQHEMRGRVYLARKDYAKARQAFEAQLKADPKSFTAVGNLAAMDLLEKKTDDARKRLRDAIEADGSNYFAILALARLQQQTDAPLEEVKDLLRKAIVVSPQSAEPRLQLISLTLRKRLYKEALVVAQEAAAAMPNDLTVMDAVGRAQMEAGDVEQAITTFRKIAGSTTNSGLAYTRLGEIYKATGKKDQAESVLRKALEVEPDLVTAQTALVDLLLSDNRKNDALEFIRKMQREAPGKAVGYSLETVFHLRNKDSAAAVQALRNGLAKTNAPILATALHRQLMRMGQTAEADKLAASWAKDHPKDTLFAYQVAESAIGRKQFDVAETRLQQLVSQQPDNVLLLNNLAYVMVQQGKPGAVAIAQKASDLAPENVSVLDTLAAAYAADKQLDKAISTQKRAIELAPDANALRMNLANLAIKAGDKTLARTELTRLQELGARFNQQQEVSRLLKTL